MRSLCKLTSLITLLVSFAVSCTPSPEMARHSDGKSPRQSSTQEQASLDAQLFTAIKYSVTWKADPKDTKRIITLLKQGANPNARDMSGIPPSRTNPHPTSSQAATPLGLFIRRKARGLPSELDKEFEPEEPIARTFLPATAEENTTVIEALLKYGADVNAAYGKGGVTALHDAVQVGKYETTVRLLLAKGANIEARDSEGNTPLMLAVRDTTYLHDEEQEKMMRILLAHGAKVNVHDKVGTTPLMLSYWRSINIAQLLLKHGATVNDRDIMGRTALRQGADQCRVEFVELLVKAGADPNIRANDGKTALQSVKDLIPVYGYTFRGMEECLKSSGAK